jgi:hypothetical protein
MKAIQQLKKLANGWFQGQDGFTPDPGVKLPFKLPAAVCAYEFGHLPSWDRF